MCQGSWYSLLLPEQGPRAAAVPREPLEWEVAGAAGLGRLLKGEEQSAWAGSEMKQDELPIQVSQHFLVPTLQNHAILAICAKRSLRPASLWIVGAPQGPSSWFFLTPLLLVQSMDSLLCLRLCKCKEFSHCCAFSLSLSLQPVSQAWRQKGQI